MKHQYPTIEQLKWLEKQISGPVKWDKLHLELFSTDASIFYERPHAVIFPKSKNDIQLVLKWAHKNSFPVIMRGAGTSLAGQVVGKGIIMDTSRYLNNLLEVNSEEKFAWVEPGAILDSLNRKLKQHNLFFGPETSTANRCTLGGMLGNNSCGLHSPYFGTTRENILEVKGFLSDGTPVQFGEVSSSEFNTLCASPTVGPIYTQLKQLLTPANKDHIRKHFPDQECTRRNMGYALDSIMESSPFSDSSKTPLNICKLLAGSEGTLMVVTELKIKLVAPLPPKKALICAHYHNLNDCLIDNISVMKLEPSASELMDGIILQMARKNKTQLANSYFIEGEPEALLLIELNDSSDEALKQKIKKVHEVLRSTNKAYASPALFNKDITSAWNLRKAGLGVLGNMPGDAKPTCFIEDTAVPIKSLPAYIKEVQAMLKTYNKQCVYYAHTGSGEIHLRPVINLKDDTDREIMYNIAKDTAALVKKYRGSLSGEHGDGLLRSEFIPYMFDDKIMDWFRSIKLTWDSKGILNPGKIMDAPPMMTKVRSFKNPQLPFSPFFRYPKQGGLIQAVDNCTGSGDCRKPFDAGGVMCPSYKASFLEKNSTRGRAKALKSFIYERNPELDLKSVSEAMELCLSCKACKTECPSSVDVARFKSEFLHYKNQTKGISLKDRITAHLPSINRMMALAPGISNFILKSKSSKLAFKQLGISTKRTMPAIKPLKNIPNSKHEVTQQTTILLFVDEFTRYNHGDIATKAIALFRQLGYKVRVAPVWNSGRTFISKGFLNKAKSVANSNCEKLSPVLQENNVIVGLEPSTLLTFRDEYPDLVDKKNIKSSENIAQISFTFEEFISNEISKGSISTANFRQSPHKIGYHEHCYQKSLSQTSATVKTLELVANGNCEAVGEGCCGMAGAFGYEHNNYQLSMAIGEENLFKNILTLDSEAQIIASGTSCRHQIEDGTHKKALHPVELLYAALK